MTDNIIHHPMSGDLHIRKSTAGQLSILLMIAAFIGGMATMSFWYVGENQKDHEVKVFDLIKGLEQRLEDKVDDIENWRYLSIQENFHNARMTQAHVSVLERRMIEYGISDIPRMEEPDDGGGL